MINNAFKALKDHLDGIGHAWSYYDDLPLSDLKGLDKDFSTASNKQDPLSEGAATFIINDLYEKFGVIEPKDKKIPVSVDKLLEILKEHAPSEEERLKLDTFATKRKNYQLIRTLQDFNKYLQGHGEGESLPALLAGYDKKMAGVNKDFYKTTIDSDPALGKAVGDILTTLGVDDKRKRGRYVGSPVAVRQFLKEVVQYHQTPENKHKIKDVNVFNQIILDKSRVSRQKALLFGLLGLLPIVGGLSYNGFSAAQQIFTAALFTPVVGIVAAVGAGAYAIYESLSRKNVPWIDKLRDNFFIVAGTALKISAYGLVIAAAVTAAPVVAILTTVAAGIGVIREAAKLIAMRNAKQKIVDGDLHVKQNQARLDDEIAKTKKTVWLRLGVAIVLTGIAAVACFAPGGIFVVIGAGIAMALTSLVQWRAEKAIAKSTTDLHAKFQELEQEDARQELNRPQVEADLTSSDAIAVRALAAAPKAHIEPKPSAEEESVDTRRDSTDDGYNSERSSDPATPTSPYPPTRVDSLSRDAIRELTHKRIVPAVNLGADDEEVTDSDNPGL